MPNQTVRDSIAADSDAATVRVMNALRRVVRALGTSARRPSDRASVSGARLFVLRQIGDAPGLSVKELAARTLSRQSTVSEVVARLVDAGLVERRASESDARQVALHLTTRGREEVADTELTAQERLAQALDALPASQREDLATALETWIAAAGLAHVPPTMFFEGGARGRSR